MCSHVIPVIAPFVDGFVPKKANKYRETRVEVTFKNSVERRKGREGGSRVYCGPARVTRRRRVAVLYEQASHKLSRLFKKLEKGASALRGTACAKREG